MSTKRGNKLAAQETGRGVTPQRHAPARHGDNSMRVYDVLRQRIATRQYAPGSRLTEAEIAQEFEISRTPVRQALHRLAVEGLVEVKNGVGIRVTEVDDKELMDIYELRMSLAALIGKLSPRPLSGSVLLVRLTNPIPLLLRRYKSTAPGCDRFTTRGVTGLPP